MSTQKVSTHTGVNTYTIVTNNHVREIVPGFQLPVEARDDFDYLDWAPDNDETMCRDFVQYRGDWYDLGDVMLAPDSIKALGYDGFNPDTYFSGIGFRYFDRDGNLLDGLVVARIAVL